MPDDGAEPHGAPLPELSAPEVQARLVEHLVAAGVAPRQSLVRRAERLSAGFSYETWRVELDGPSGGSAAPGAVIVKRQPLSGPLAPYDVSREATLLRSLAATEVPVPAVLSLCRDPGVLGSPFSILELVEGDVPDYRTLRSTALWRDPTRREAMAEEFVRVLGLIQSVDWRAQNHDGVLEPVCRAGRAAESMGRSAERFLGRSWSGLPAFRDAGAWLAAHDPETPAEHLVLVHGDYKVGNFIWRDDGIAALLDWEMATVGDPLWDMGYACHPIMREQQPDLMAMLLPLEDLVARYEQDTGRRIDMRRLHYFVIFALYFHAYTVLAGLVAVAEQGSDFRLAPMYSKLNQVTRHLVRQIEAYEDGKGVV